MQQFSIFFFLQFSKKQTKNKQTNKGQDRDHTYTNIGYNDKSIVIKATRKNKCTFSVHSEHEMR